MMADDKIVMKHIDIIVSHLKKKDCKVGFFVGAGISTNCGIPDFRSPETGLYANLERLKLPYPEAVFDIDYFRKSPKAFYTLAEELFPGKFVPSRFHYMIKLFQDKGILKRCYTQNIDTLERITGVDDDRVLEAHGSFSKNHCIDCDTEMSQEKLVEFMDRKEIPICPKCQGYVKPDIVFFGEALPPKLWDFWEEDIDQLDVAIVAGTSLAVYPFASLPSEVGRKTKRILINRELCGDFKENPRNSDIVLQQDCDRIANLICEKMGWLDELDVLAETGKKSILSSSKSDLATETAEELVQELVDEVAPILQEDVKDKEQEAHKTAEEHKKEPDVDSLIAAVEKVEIK